MDLIGFPSQRKTKAEKNSDWCKKTIDALINNSEFGGRENRDLHKLYRYYKGEIKQSDYKYVLDPYNTNQKFKYPARLRNYNIIKPVVDLLIGEKSKRPRDISIISTNPDAIGILKEQKQAFVKKRLQDHFLSALGQNGLDPGVEAQPVEDLQSEAKQFELSYNDQRAALGQDIYDYITWSCNLNDTYQELFADWVIYGNAVSYTESAWDDVYYDIVKPWEFDYDRNPRIKYIEDGAWAVRRVRMSASEIIDRWHDLLTEDQINYLENPQKGEAGDISISFTNDGFEFDKPATDNDRFHYVYHTVWKTLVKIGILTYYDEVGQIQQMEVSEDYLMDEEDGDIDIQWEWVNEVWHGFRIGKDIFIKLPSGKEAERFPVQRRSLNNPSDCKLPYNGRVLEVSPVEVGIPYQELYNVFHYRLELSIAKNKDKIALLDYNMIPKKKGWDEDKFMFMAEAAGFAFLDPLSENARGEKSQFSAFQVLDMSLGNYISSQFELLKAVQDEYESSLGISRQRKGNILASDGRGTTERAVFQSSVMSEEMFRKFDEFERRDAQTLVDTGKQAYAQGKKATYINSEGNLAFLDLEPEDVRNLELGVVASNSSADFENIQTMKSLVLEFVQGGMSASSVAELLESKSMAKIKQKLLKVEQMQREWEMKLKEMDNETAQMNLDAAKEDREDKQLHEAEQNELDRQKDIILKEMEIASRGDGIDDGKDEKLQLDREKFSADNALKTRAQRHKEYIDNKKLALEKDKLKVQARQKQTSKSK